MSKWFTTQGLNQNDIIRETNSKDTFENVSFSIQELKKQDIYNPKITVITSFMHALRFYISFYFAHKIKIKIHSKCYSLKCKEFIKECFFFLVHLIDPKGIGFLANLNRKNRLKK